MKIVFTSIILILLPVIAFADSISFVREDLDFELRNNTFYIDGYYHFKNNTTDDIRIILLYPFPEDSLFFEADSIYAYKVGSDSLSVVTRLNSTGALFKVDIPPNARVVYRIGYQQKVKGNYAEYILLTTRDWGEKLEEANYCFTVPNHTIIDSISYTADKIVKSDSVTKYFWKKENFMPHRNFKVWFRKD